MVFSEKKNVATMPHSHIKHNYDILRKMVDSGLRVKVAKGPTKKTEYWKFFSVDHDETEKIITCCFRRGKQKATFSEIMTLNPVIKYRGSWKPFQIILCPGIMRGNIMLKNNNVPEISSTEKSSILKLRRGRKSAVELQFLNSFKDKEDGDEEMIQTMKNAISKTHKAVVMQTEIRKLLNDVDVNETNFFEKVANVIETHGGTQMNGKRLQYSQPPSLPEDILSVKIKQMENPHIFTNSRKTKKQNKEKNDFTLLDEAMRIAKLCVSNTPNTRYVVWPHK